MDAAISRSIKKLEKRLDHLTKLYEQVKPLTTHFGYYHDKADKNLLCMIIAAFPTAGTVDILLFDTFSGGVSDHLTGLEFGDDVGQVSPFHQPVEEVDYELTPEVDEVEPSVVASEPN